jgi:dimethylaniline monooxygenase (N-oxide forming)
VDGKPFDHHRTYRKGQILGLMTRYTESLWMKIMDSFILRMRNRIYDLKPEWGLDPAPSFSQQRPILSDNLIDNFSKGLITSLPEIREVLSATTIEFVDGNQVDVDSIIWCTGYTLDYSIL